MIINDRQQRPLHILTLSAKTPTALRSLAVSYQEYLQTHPELKLADVCFTANTGRSHFRYRSAFVTDSTADLCQQLSRFAISYPVENTRLQPKVAFLFTGQGSQYIGMAKELYDTHPRFREVLEICDRILSPYLEQPLLKVLDPTSPASQLLNSTAYTQPALFAIEYALFQLWKSWGIVPDAVMGHSVGEYVAACVAGVFSLEDGLKLIADRAKLMENVNNQGMMAAVFANQAQVESAIAYTQTQVAIAGVNAPNHTVISGDRESVLSVQKKLEFQGVEVRPLNVSGAFHSHLMSPILESFREIAGSIKYSAPQIPIVSNVTGKFIEAGFVFDADYWCRHLRGTVQFARGMDSLGGEGYNTFVEIGTHPTLLNLGRRCQESNSNIWLPSLKKGKQDWQVILQSLAELYTHSLNVDWVEFDKYSKCRRVVLPSYPFERQRYWVGEAVPSQAIAFRHPLLGSAVGGK